MKEVKKAFVVGAMEITRATIECPACYEEIEYSYSAFEKVYGSTFTGDHIGKRIHCRECGEEFIIDEFKLED